MRRIPSDVVLLYTPPMPATLRIVPGDLDDPRVVELVTLHRTRASAETMRGSAHSLDTGSLRAPDIGFWTMFEDERLIGMGALRRLAAELGEIKSMFVVERARGRGVATTMLRHLLAEARAQGLVRVSLETGSWAYFAPAHALYRRHGFVDCPPFEGYVADPNSRFMTLSLA